HLKESVIRDIVEDAKVEWTVAPIARGSQPMSHVNPNRISPAKGDTKPPIDDKPRKNKSHLRTSTRVNSCPNACESQPKSHVKPNRISPAKDIRNAHLDYLRHLKESVETIRDIVEEAKVVRPLDRSIVSAYHYTKHSQELLKYAIGTCPHGSQPRAKELAHIPLIRKKARVDCCPIAHGSQPMSHVKPNRISPAKDRMVDVNAPSDQTPTMAPPRKHRFHPRPDSPLHLSNEEPVLGYLKFGHNSLIIASRHELTSVISRDDDSVEHCLTWAQSMSNQLTSSSCQLDEQWFDLTKETLREALQITPINRNQAFAAPPSIDGLVDFVNQLGYPKLVMNLSTVVTNDLFQPWRALLTIINLCLTRKTSRFERPRDPVLQILWGIVTRANIDYAERIWEEFTQSIHTFIEGKRNLSRHTSGKKRATLIVIPSIQFTKLIIHHLVLGYLKFSAKCTKREIFRMPIPTSYYQEYQENVAKHKGFLAGETGSTQDLPAPKPAKPSMKPQSTAQKSPPKPSISSPVTST
nr:hypothetical protein [Tanacetum cinerariifolium]